jgi:ornithine cyclodeaminase/alanine dehydrogenase-like protein (mu-crystallin family)
MPASAGATFGVKVVSVTPGNAGRGLPTVQAAVLLLDEPTGTPVALLDGTYLTQLRTGAAMGLGADLLARPDADVVALFGAGATARTSLAAVCSVRPIREVRVVHPHAEHFPAFARDVESELGAAAPILRRVEDPREALRGSRVVITATTSATPLFPGAAIEPGAYVGALGAYTPSTRELDTAAILRARVVVDAREATLREAGDLVIPMREGAIGPDDVYAEIGEIAAGARPGRTSPDEIFLFKSVGNALQDLTLASRVYTRARERGLGTTIPIFGSLR